jgi:hypothetical protein
MSFVDGDRPLLWHLFEYRYLRSGQLAALSDRSTQVIRRRMRELAALQFVVPLSRAVMEEQGYCLGPKGFDFVAEELGTVPEKLPFSRKVPNVESQYWRHTLLVNQTRISVSLAAQEHPHVVLHQCIAEWEMADPTEDKDPTKKFLLWKRLYEKSGSNEYVTWRPDSLFLVHRRDDTPDHSVAMFLEADRGTQSVGHRINYKYKGYKLYRDQQGFWKFHKAVTMRVLFVLEDVSTDRRMKAMQTQLQFNARQLGDPEGKGAAAFVHDFRFTRAELLNEKSVFDEPVWQDWQGNPVRLFNPPKQEAVR